MRLQTFSLSAILLATAFASSSAAAGVYLKVDIIKGDSEAKGREDWIELYGVSGAFANSQCGEWMLQKPVSQASPKIVENTFLATALGKVTIEATRQIGDKDVVYLQMELDASSNLRELFTKFTSVSTEVHPSWGLMEQISLSFGHTNMTYTVFNEFGEKEGEVTSAFDCG